MPEPKVFRVADTGRGFASRGKGRVAFERFQELLNRQPAEHSPAIVDWSDVNIASPSFIDEFIGLGCPDGESASLWDGVIFTSIDPYVQSQMHAILRRRGCELKYAPTLEAARAGEVSVLGAVSAESLNSA